MTDAEALERFEAIVLGQQAAVAPWAPVTDYSFEARKQIEGKHPDLIKEVLRPMRALDVGCGPGHLVRLLRERDVLAFGCDKSHDAGGDPFRRPVLLYGAFRSLWDVSDLGKPHPCDWSDLVICREVLEHLTLLEVRRAVLNLCRWAGRYVYVTTRFHLAPRHLLDVMTADDLDPTHISMLNQTFLRTLFVLEGFKRRADLEQRMDWQGKGRCLVYERAA
jgi:SAM-dependent methyltransferase